MDITFVTLDDIKRMLDELSSEEREKLLADQLSKLSPESKSKILGLADSSLTVVTGSFVSLSSEVAINIQNTSGFDPETVFKALAEYRKAEKGD